MFTQFLFNVISCLIFSRVVRGFEAYHDQYEESYVARIGLLHLDLNRCFVLSHKDAAISLRLPIPLWSAQGWIWGKLHIGYVTCLGEEQFRQPGFHIRWHKSLPKVVYGQAYPPDDDDDFPF